METYFTTHMFAKVHIALIHQLSCTLINSLSLTYTSR